MKIHYRIPTSEQYAYVEVEQEMELSTTSEDIRSVYDDLTAAFKVREGLPDKDFDQFIQKVIENNPNEIEDLEGLSPDQHKLMQIVKRAVNRIEYKGRKELKEQDNHLKNIT